MNTVILRPCHIVGPGINNGIMQYINAKIVPTVAGFNPMIQIIHIQDVFNAISLVMKRRARGIFNISSQDQIPILTFLKELKIRHIPVMPPFEKLVFKVLFSTGLTSLHPEQIDFLKYPCMVDDTSARESLLFSPKYRISDIIKELRLVTRIQRI